MEKIQMVDLKGQHNKIRDEIDAAIKKVVDSAAFINGPEVETFRNRLKEYLDIKHVITCGNGTDALQIALMALETEPGDEVITTPFTFIATAEAISLLKLKPVFVDIHSRTFNIDTSSIEPAVTSKTKVILPVHLYGQCADMEFIMDLAGKHDLKVIEDAAQALGSEYTFRNGIVKKAGTIGDIGCTSFFPSKNLGCFGDGGAIFTDDAESGEKLKAIASHGSRIKYYHDITGVNSRLDTIQAAILDVKLRYLDRYNIKRLKAAEYYNRALGDIEQLQLPVRSGQSSHIFHAYTIIAPPGQRDALRDYLSSKNIPSMVYYPVPMHLQKAYIDCGYREGDFPVSEELCKRVLSLPMHTELAEEQLEYICHAITDYFT